MIRYGLMSLFACFFTVGCCGNGEPSVGPQNVEIWLDDSITKNKGFSWSKTEQDWEEFAAIERPANVTLHFKSGRTIHIYSKVSMLAQHGGVVSRVTLTPVQKLQTFDDALLSLEGILKELGIEKQLLVKSKLEEWARDPPNHSPFEGRSLASKVEDGVDFYAEIVPHYQPYWYLSVKMFASRFYEPH